MPPEPAELQLRSLPGLLQQLHSAGLRKKSFKEQSPPNSKGYFAEACRCWCWRTDLLGLWRGKWAAGAHEQGRGTAVSSSQRGQCSSPPGQESSGSRDHSPASLRYQQIWWAPGGRTQWWDAAAERGKTPCYSFLHFSLTGPHLGQHNTASCLLGSGSRTWNNWQEVTHSDGKGRERGRKTHWAFPEVLSLAFPQQTTTASALATCNHPGATGITPACQQHPTSRGQGR